MKFPVQGKWGMNELTNQWSLRVLSYSREEQAAWCGYIALPLFLVISCVSLVVWYFWAIFSIGEIGVKVKSKISEGWPGKSYASFTSSCLYARVLVVIMPYQIYILHCFLFCFLILYLLLLSNLRCAIMYTTSSRKSHDITLNLWIGETQISKSKNTSAIRTQPTLRPSGSQWNRKADGSARLRPTATVAEGILARKALPLGLLRAPSCRAR